MNVHMHAKQNNCYVAVKAVHILHKTDRALIVDLSSVGLSAIQMLSQKMDKFVKLWQV